MKKQYNVEEFNGQKSFWYEEDGMRISFLENPESSEYQAYLNKDNPENPVGGN